VQTGAYNDVVLDEEFFWAAAELWVTTGKQEYMKQIEGKLGKITFRVEESWRNYVDNLGYYSLLVQPGSLSDADRKVVLNGLTSLADSLAAVLESHPYRVPLHHFKWGSNSDIVNMATVFIIAYHYTHDKKYRNYALETVDYVFGKNATGYSFVTGFGSRTPMNIHHRPSAADGIAEPFPGFLVGGPNADRQDLASLKVAGFFYAFDEPARCYIDETPSFASNEICLNWNAPLTFVLGYLSGKEE
jgi:endoglucanase